MNDISTNRFFLWDIYGDAQYLRYHSKRGETLPRLSRALRISFYKLWTQEYLNPDCPAQNLLISLHSVHPMTRRMSYFSHLTQLLPGLFILFSMTTNKLSYISAIYFQFRYLAPRYIVYLLVKRRSWFPYGGPLNALHKTLRFSAITIQSFFRSYFPKYLRLIYLGFKGFAIYDSEYLEI